jgi:predicted ATPase
VTRSDQVGPAIVRALAVTPLHGDVVRDALRRELGAKALLLVIDNFEHVLAAADLIAELHGACRRLKILVTSREALDLSCERRVPVAPLAVPGSESVSVAEIESTDATALFVSAARRRDSRFVLTAASAPAIARMCARLDGLPLALELAAARTEILGVEELAARLEELSGLGRGPRDAPARQHTLRETIEWSYRLLDAEQRVAFCGFAVFAGGATVTGSSIQTLEELVAKSLINRRNQRDGTTRLVMLETVRRYALERLGRRSMERSVREAHTAFYLHLIKQAASRLHTRDEHLALAVIDSEIDNAHAALRWALQFAPVSALKLAGHLGDFGTIRGEPGAQRLLEAALNAAGEQAAA